MDKKNWKVATVSAAVGFIICLLIWRPWQTTIVMTPKRDAEIVKTVTQKQEPNNKKIDSLEKDKRVLVERNTTLEKKLYAAQQINKELAKQKPALKKSTADSIKHVQNDPDLLTEIYIQQLKDGAAASDLACNETVENLHDQVSNRDSTIAAERNNNKILQTGFDDMKQNSALKDDAIKKLNNSFKWQKIQNYALKGGIAAAVIYAIVNSIK